LISDATPAKRAEVEARAGREGKGVRRKGIPAPPERNFLEISIRIFFEKGSDFVQDRQHFWQAGRRSRPAWLRFYLFQNNSLFIFLANLLK